MASIVGKKQADRPTTTCVESARVGGKPTIVSQRYLGKADEIEAAPVGVGAGRCPTARGTSPSATWPRCGRCSSASGWPAIVDEVVGPAPVGCGGVGGDLLRPGRRQPGGRPVLEARLRGVVGDHRRRPLGEAARRRLSTTGGSGTPWTRSPSEQLVEIERRVVARHGGVLRPRLLGARARHDQLRHLHRLGERPGPDRPAGSRQAEAHRPAPGRSRPRGVHRRRRPAGQPRLCRQPPRRHPVRRGGGRAGRAVRAAGRSRGRAHLGL